MSGSADASPWLGAWLRERVIASSILLAPLAFFMTLAGGTRQTLVRTTIAFLGIVVFRLWDDVEDLGHDRRHHPMRVLCRLSSADEPFRMTLLGLLFTGTTIGVFGGALAPFFVAVVLSFGAYSTRRRFVSPGLRVVFAHVILLKVPALSLALADAETLSLVAFGRAVTLYGVVGAYELAHDEDARRSPLAPVLALVDLACLCGGPAIWLLLPRVFP